MASATSNAIAQDEATRVKDKEKEMKRAKRMIIPPECKCHLNSGQQCHTRFSVGELMDTRMHYMSTSKKELDIAVLAKLECGIHLTKMTTRKKRKPTVRKKHRTDFYHRGFRICNQMFVYLHGFSYKKLKALILQYKTNGVKMRIHKNLKPKPQPGEVKVKKKKPRAKPKPKEPRKKKPRVKKPKLDKDAAAGGGIKAENKIAPLQYQSMPVAKLHQALPPPPQPSQHHHPYPVPFPLSNQGCHPQAAPPFMPAAHTSQPAFSHPLGYNSPPVFPPHAMAGRHSHPHPHPHPHSHGHGHGHPVVTSSHNNPPLDYSNQRALANPPLDFSNQRTNPSSMQNFDGSDRPCVTYSVVHSVTF